MVINKITSKTLPAHSGEQQRETSSHSLHVNTNVNRSIQPSVPSNTVTQHCQRAPQSNAPVLSKLVSNNPSKDAFAAPKPLTFRRLTPSEFASKHSQATLNPPPAPTGLGNIRTPSPRNAHIPNPNQIPLNLTASSATCPNSSASRNNTFQPQPAPINLSREYNSHANTASSSTEACSAAESTNHNFLSTSTDRQGNTAPAEPNYQIGNCHSSLLLSELLRVGKRDTHSTLNKNLMVNLPFTKPLPYTPKSPSVSTNIDRPKPRINVIQNKVIFPKKHKTRNVRPSNELFKHLRGQASVQNETRPYQLASSEAVSSLNLTGSTERGTLDHYVAKSNVDSNSQDMTFSNNQLTKDSLPFIPTTEDSDQNTATSSIQSASLSQTHISGTPTSLTDSTMMFSPSTQAAIVTIDLTWIDDMNETDLQNDMDFVFVKQENSEAQQHTSIDSPTDSGVESPGLQNEEEPTLTYVSRLCPCSLTATYTCACGDAWYCGQACQLNDWTYHQRICHRVNETAAN